MKDTESSLLAVLLVVASPTNSNQVVFSYPANPTPIPRLSRPVYEKTVIKRRRKTSSKSAQPAASLVSAVVPSESSSTSSSDEDVVPRRQPVKSRRQSSSAAQQPSGHNGLRHSSPSPMPAYDSGSSSGSTTEEGSEDDQYVNGSEDEDKPETEEGQDSPSPISALFHPRLAHQPRTNGDALPANAAYSELLGIDVDILSQCLLKKSLRDSKFELVIDYLAFIGHPVWLDRGRKRIQEEQEKHAAAAAANRKDSFDAASTTTHSARGRSPVPAGSSTPQESPLEGDTSESASHASPQTERSKALHSLPPSPSPAHQPLPPSKPPSIIQASTPFIGDLTMFNLVLIIDTPPDKHLSSHLDVYYKDVVVKLTAAIKFEELKDGWLSREASNIFRMREQAKDQNQPFAAYTADLIAQSSLCRALAKVYDSVTTHQIAKLSNLNEDLDMSIMLRDSLFLESPYGTQRNTMLRRATDLDLDADGLNPWQTLVPLIDPKDMLDDLDGGPLAQFVEIMSPTVNFQEYTTLLDLAHFELKDLVDHLVYWRKARIINVVNVRNTYVLNPARGFSELASHSADFARAFPKSQPLVAILSQLSRAQPFSSIIPPGQRKAEYLEVLIWLLKTNLVVQQRECYRVIVSPKIKQQTREARRTANSSDEGAESQERTDDGGASSFDGRTLYNKNEPFFEGVPEESEGSLSHIDLRRTNDSLQSTPEPSPEIGRRVQPQPLKSSLLSQRNRKAVGKAAFASSAMEEPISNVIPEPGMPEVWEKRWLNQILATRPEQAQRFERILPYLNGCFDLEEVAFRSDMSKREVKTLCGQFLEHLVVFCTP